MSPTASYLKLMNGLRVFLCVLAGVGVATAQQRPVNVPTPGDLYCSGVATDQPVANDTYVISGQNAAYRLTYAQGTHVFINHGSQQGVKVGDEFEVVRPVHDLMQNTQWFKWQVKLTHAMGTMYADVGRIRVVNVQAKTSIAQVDFSCDMLQRGDIVRPFTARTAPVYHDVSFNRFAPPSGKKTAMVVTTKNFGQAVATGSIVYVNLGSAQGVKVGDYFRVFRYQGTRSETPYQVSDAAYKVYGYGSTPVAYQPEDLPRENVGEGIVLRTGPNSATVVLTFTNQVAYAGDYVELE